MPITLDRNLSVGTDLETKKQSLIAAPILYLDFPSVVQKFAGSNININVPTSTIMPSGIYQGVGGISSISSVEESIELQSNTLTAVINGIDNNYVALVLGQQYYGRDASLAIAVLDTNYKLIGEPILVFKGIMSVLSIDLASNASITVEIESIFADWERPRVKRYNSTSQETVEGTGTDYGFHNVARIVNKEVAWGK